MRTNLWGLASHIVSLDYTKMQQIERKLYKGQKTSRDDTALIKISRLIRQMYKELKQIESKLK